uniref:Uncharacterized protein n=1 Tax=Anguilla anguilla TaxID=7936 RepID=A0A0E9T6E9_ANGAN
MAFSPFLSNCTYGISVL